MLRFWAQDENGNELYSGSKEYGSNFKSIDGMEPVMEFYAVGRGFYQVLDAENLTRVHFKFPAPKDGRVKLNATLTYVFIAPPPGETMNWVQQKIIAKIKAAKTQAEKDQIVNEEVPARMRSMNALATTFPDIQMAKVSKLFDIEARKIASQ